MREIKFRAWDSGSSIKQFIYFSFGDIWSDGYMDNEKRIHNGPHQILLACQGMDNPDIIIEQYTGLHDKNGREIYEGDIISYDFQDYDGGDHYFRLPVESLGASFVCVDKNYGTYDLNCIHDADMEWKIVGNIHENPELVKSH